MAILSLDTENDTHSKGSPYDGRFKSVCYSVASESVRDAIRTDEAGLQRLRTLLGDVELIVGFNWKYDLGVFRRLGVDLTEYPIFDCQLAEFILTNQTTRYPSLEDCLVKYGIGHKLDIVKTEYWAKGIQTSEIPWDILSEYAIQDAVMTLELYHAQMLMMNDAQRKLHKLMCMDLVILQEMEWNGLRYDKEMCEARSTEIKTKILEINKELSSVYPDVPINFNSGDQLSSFLYGGIVAEERRVHDGFFKSGAKTGQPKYRKEIIQHQLPRLVAPVKGSELKKDGFFATNEATLRKLNGAKKAIGLILELAKLEKINGTYYEGIPKLCDEQYWEPEYIHGQFNQVVAQTGRLSSNKPNLQNLSGDILDVVISRY